MGAHCQTGVGLPASFWRHSSKDAMDAGVFVSVGLPADVALVPFSPDLHSGAESLHMVGALIGFSARF